MEQRGAHEGGGRAWGGRHNVGSKSPGLSLFQKDRSQRFHSVWTPFDIPFLRNSETGNKTAIWAGPPVNRLVPKAIQKCIIKPINIQNR